MEITDENGTSITVESKEQEIWNRVKKLTEARIKSTEEALIVDKAFLDLCVKKIEESKI